MSTMSPVSKDSPLWKAWEQYVASDEYANSKKWALIPEHTEGSLWAAFDAGFRARAPQEAGEARAEGFTEMERLAVIEAIALAVKQRPEIARDLLTAQAKIAAAIRAALAVAEGRKGLCQNGDGNPVLRALLCAECIKHAQETGAFL